MATKQCCGNCACWTKNSGSPTIGKCRVNNTTTGQSSGATCKYWR